MAESQSKILITIPHQILLGCFDMISAYGGDPSNKEPEQVVSDVLKSLILGMQNDHLIPSYESETELYAQLDKYFPDLKSSNIAQLEQMADKLGESIREGDSFSGVKEEIDPSVVQNIKEEGESEEKLKTTLTFQELDEKDLYVIESKGDPKKEQALVEVYTVLAKEMRGTPGVRKMWELFLNREEKEENIPTPESGAEDKTAD